MPQRYRLITTILIAALSLVFTSCGGGGSASTGTVTSTLSFPLDSGLRDSVINGSLTSYTVSGTCSGTANSINSTPISATFESVSGVSTVSTMNIGFTNCTPSYISGTSTDYYDTNYIPLGTIVTGSKYEVLLAPPTIPVSVKVGDMGTIGTINDYTDSTKSAPDGHDVISYVVEPDTADTAIVNLIDKYYDVGGILTSTSQDRYRIVANGTLTPVSSDIQYANGSTLHLILTAIPEETYTAIPIVPINPPPARLWQPTSGSIPATGNFVYMQSDPGDYVGQGQTYTYTQTNATIYVNENNGHLSVGVTGNNKSWNGDFQTMNTISQLQPGYYPVAQRYLNNPDVVSTLNWYGDGRACDSPMQAWFVVDNVTYVNNILTAIGLRFEQHCDGATAALHGVIHWAP